MDGVEILKIGGNSSRIIFKAKKIVSLALVFLLSITIILSITAVVYKVNSSNKNEITVYALDDGVLSQEDYDNYNYFSILSSEGLVNLSNFVNSGFSFKKKEISLLKDIDMAGVQNWQPIGQQYYKNGRYFDYTFEGSFDGNGHTISNLTCSEGSVDKGFGGLFGYLGGQKYQEYNSRLDYYYDVYPVVSGIRIKDIKIIKDKYTSSFVAGGLAAWVQGDVKIQKVEVSGLTVKTENGKDFFDDLWVGGIVGSCQYYYEDDYYSKGYKTSNVLLENCYVESFSVTGEFGVPTIQNSSFESASDCCIAGLGPANLFYKESYGQNICTLQNSVLKQRTVSINVSASKLTELYVKDFAMNKAPNKVISSHYGDDKVIAGELLSVTVLYCYSDINKDFSTLDFARESESGVWFYDEMFNEGFPKLQYWVGKKARFDVYPYNDTAGGKVDDNSGVFKGDQYNNMFYSFQPDPKDKTYVENTIVIDSSTAELKIGDKILVATPSQDNKYEFYKWEYLYVKAGTEYNNRYYNFDIHVYTAKFRLKICTVTFEANDLAEFTGPNSVQMLQDNIITITRTKNSDNTFTYTYTMINVEGETITVQYKLTNSKYTLKDVGESSEFVVEGTAFLVNPNFVVKTYDVNLS